MTMPGQVNHCWVAVAAGAKKSVVVGEGIGVVEGVRVGVDVGKEKDMAVTVRIADVSIEKMEGKFESGLDAPRLHALSRKIAAMINIKKYFLIRMAASILE
jgi:hypothetical protein